LHLDRLGPRGMDRPRGPGRTVIELFAEIARHVTGMAWKIAWGLILGFGISAVVQVCVRNERVAERLGQPTLGAVALATAFGAASSSCSYAAAAMSKTLFRKGAHLVNATAFLFASTNLVIEIGLVIWVLLGWRFVVAEVLGGLLLIGIASPLVANLPRSIVEAARSHLRDAGGEDGHGGPETRPVRALLSTSGWVAVGRTFRSDWRMVGRDIVLGIAIAGTLAAVVPHEVWQALFPAAEPGAGQVPLRLIGVHVLIGPLVAVLSSVCSVGNIPLAAVLWENGISFAGVIAFVFADLLALPMLLVYRRYYGLRPALAWSACLLAAIVASAVIVELVFRSGGWIPPPPPPGTASARDYFAWDYTTVLNAIFVPLGLLLAYLGGRPRTEPEAHHGASGTSAHSVPPARS